MRRLYCLVVVVLCLPAVAGKLPLMPSNESDMTVTRKKVSSEDKSSSSGLTRLETLKMKKRFGLGLVGGGGYGIMGLEGDINIIPEVSFSIGWGTGIDYNSFNVKVRYFLLGEWVSPYVGFGLAHWWASGKGDRNVSPAILRNKFLSGVNNLQDGFSIFMGYPCIGVQFMHSAGFAASAEVMALFKFFNMANGTYAGASFHWYF